MMTLSQPSASAQSLPGGCQIGRSAVQAGRALASLVAITGNLDRPGSNRMGGPPTRIIANGDAIAAGRLTSEQRRKRLGAERFPVLGKGYDFLDDALARAWHGKRHLLSSTVSAHEPSLWRAITTAQPYPVKALFVQHHNPWARAPTPRWWPKRCAVRISSFL